MTKNTVLITGGSGFLGINLCRFLHSKGYKIIVVDIAPFEYADMKDNIEFVEGDVRDLEVLKNVAKKIDFVVHTAAALPLWPKEDIFSTDIKGTENVLEASKFNDVKRVVHISSTAI